MNTDEILVSESVAVGTVRVMDTDVVSEVEGEEDDGAVAVVGERLVEVVAGLSVILK
jgi:hypothetical protein